MKRFISYLLLCFSILFSVFVCFDGVFKNVNGSSDFADGEEFYYQVSLKDTDDYINKHSDRSGENGGFITEADFETSIDDVVSEMKRRLDNAGITKAAVEKISDTTNGMYTIRVAYTAQDQQMYDIIDDYLTFDRNLSISLIQDRASFEQYSADGKEQMLFKYGEAELVPANPTSQKPEEQFPIIKLPLANPQYFHDEIFSKFVEQEDGTKGLSHGPKYEGETEGEPEEAKPEDYIYVVNNWKNEYELKDALDEQKQYSTDARKSIIYAFNAKNPDSMFFNYDAESETNGFLKIPYNIYAKEFLQDENISRLDLRMIGKSAEVELDKLNAPSYRVDIRRLNEQYPTAAESNKVEATEKLVSYGKLLVSSLLIATITAVVLVTLFMALSYGINAITGLAMGSATTLLAAGMLSLFSVEFNIGTIVALVVVAIASIFSSCLYFKSIRENCYLGKTLKKSQTEASKKTMMYHVDISVIMVILGVVGYVMDNSILMSIGAVLICGGIFNFLLSAIALRGLTWLLTNSSYVENHLGILKIDKKFVPDLLNDEKPTYFEPLKKIKSNKTRNIVVAAVTGALLLGSIIAIPTVLSTQGDIYGKPAETVLNSQIHISYTIRDQKEEMKNFKEDLIKLLNNVYYVEGDGSEAKVGDLLKYDEANIDRMYYQGIFDGTETEYRYTYIVPLKEAIKEEERNKYPQVVYSETELKKGDALGALASADIASLISDNIEGLDSVNFMVVKNYADDFLNYNILIYSLISVSVATAYILLRFGLGKALISLVAVGGISTISVGVFSMLQVGLTSANTLAVIIIALVGYAILLHYFNREREMRKENKAKIRDEEGKQEILKLSSNLSFETALSAVALSFLVIVSFLLSPSFSQGIVLISALGILLIILFVQALVLPMDNINKKLWNKTKVLFNTDKFTKKKGDKKKKKHTDGPEEATFIGIND